jgi:hypothetical protein
MDANVTKRLWDFGDIVDVLEAWEATQLPCLLSFHRIRGAGYAPPREEHLTDSEEDQAEADQRKLSKWRSPYRYFWRSK